MPICKLKKKLALIGACGLVLSGYLSVVDAFVFPVQSTNNYNININCPSRSGAHPFKRSANTRLQTRSVIPTPSPQDDLYSDAFSVPILPLLVALGVGIAAQTFINSMLQGDQGLAAFLSDGGGFNKSGFRPTKQKQSTTKKTDPLPWLKLPELDFVDVAGQEKVLTERELMMKLERLRESMQTALNESREQDADSIQKELEQIMDTYGIEYTTDELPPFS